MGTLEAELNAFFYYELAISLWGPWAKKLWPKSDWFGVKLIRGGIWMVRMNLTESSLTQETQHCACWWRIMCIRLIEVKRHILTVGGSTPWAEVLDWIQGESELSTSAPQSLLQTTPFNSKTFSSDYFTTAAGKGAAPKAVHAKTPHRDLKGTLRRT